MSYSVCRVSVFVLDVQCAVCKTEVHTDVLVTSDGVSIDYENGAEVVVSVQERRKLTDWCVEKGWWFDDHAEKTKAHICPKCLETIRE